jgi:hypothetical protein
MNINLPKFKPFDHNSLLTPAFVPKVSLPELVPKSTFIPKSEEIFVANLPAAPSEVRSLVKNSNSKE